MWKYNKYTRTSHYHSDSGVSYAVLWPYLGSGLTYQIWVPDGPSWSLH